MDHLVRTRGVDPDASLDASQRAIAVLVQRTLEEHYEFVLAYTHLIREEGLRHTSARFNSVPAIVRPLVGYIVRGRIKTILWQQGVLRHSHEDIIESAPPSRPSYYRPSEAQSAVPNAPVITPKANQTMHTQLIIA